MWRSVALSSSRPTPLIKQGRVLFLLLVATVFAVTGATLPFIFAEVSDEIAHSTRYEPSFNAVQLKTSVARLNAAAALYQAAPSPTRLRALRIAASVLVGWARDIDHGEFGRFTASNPAMQADAKAFQADVGELQNLLASPDRQDLATAVDAEVQRIDPLLNAHASRAGAADGKIHAYRGTRCADRIVEPDRLQTSTGRSLRTSAARRMRGCADDPGSRQVQDPQ